MGKQVQHELRERVKELHALHQTALILQDDAAEPEQQLQRIVNLLPEAWQYPELTGARIQLDGREFCTAGFRRDGPSLEAAFLTRSRVKGSIEVRYSQECPLADEGPFLAEERELINSLAQILRNWYQRREAERALQETNEQLENQVRERTQDLQDANRQLRRLASELSLTEARERREIASDLHDQIGQSLALLRIRLGQLRGNMVFGGSDRDLAEMQKLLDHTIRTTRNLTMAISPPVLYELGLAAACEWLAESFSAKHAIPVRCHLRGGVRRLHGVPEELQVTLFKAAQELLANCLKHSGATSIRIHLEFAHQRLLLEVADNGKGFDPHVIRRQEGFGLFSIRTRLRDLGGELEVDSAPGEGCRVTMCVNTGEMA